MKRAAFKILIALLISLNCPALMAGQNCRQQNISPQTFIKASQTAIRIQSELNHLNPRVAIIARAGTDLSKYGMRYSHVAFVVKEYQGRPNQWTVLHLLNQCGTEQSSIYSQGLMNFFLDNLYKMDYQIMIPNQALQKKLFENLHGRNIKRLHQKHYSMLASPYSQRYQNSNQWVLEMLADSLNPNPGHSRYTAQKYLRKTGYRPAVIRVDAIERLGVNLFKSNIKFDDHSRQEQQYNKYYTVSVESIYRYLKWMKQPVLYEFHA